MIAADDGCSGKVSILVFQALSAGNTGQPASVADPLGGRSRTAGALADAPPAIVPTSGAGAAPSGTPVSIADAAATTAAHTASRVTGGEITRRSGSSCVAAG